MSSEYQKIQGLFKRNEETREFIEGEWSLPEFQYLQYNTWEWTEKIEGMNIRVIWDGDHVDFKGKTDKAILPNPLLEALDKTFRPFPELSGCDDYTETPICLYGEGYGPGIKKGGKYRKDPGFILFDVKVGRWWLKREDQVEIAGRFGIPVVPIIGYGDIHTAITEIKTGVQSTFGDFLAEGLVLKPTIVMFARNGQRIITKVKHVDFKRES